MSPCLISTFRFSEVAYFIILLKTSLLSERCGVTYKHLIPSPSADASPLSSANIVITGIIADSVFPEPVGATNRESRLRAKTLYDWSWMEVNFAKDSFENLFNICCSN